MVINGRRVMQEAKRSTLTRNILFPSYPKDGGGSNVVVKSAQKLATRVRMRQLEPFECGTCNGQLQRPQKVFRADGRAT